MKPTPDPNWTPWNSGYTITGKLRWLYKSGSWGASRELQQEWVGPCCERVWWTIETVKEEKEE